MILNYTSFFYLFILIIILLFFIIKIYRQVFKFIKQEFYIYRLNTLLTNNHKNHCYIYFLLGTVYLDKNCLEKALDFFIKSSDYYTENARISLMQIYNSIGYVYMQIEEYHLAIQFFKKCIAIQPNYSIAINNLAKVYEKINDIKKAIDLYQFVLSYDKQNKTASDRLNNIKYK
jgi:tetratricopeptide (TPR) repeat protein